MNVPIWEDGGDRGTINSMIYGNISVLNDINQKDLQLQPHPGNDLADGSLVVTQFNPKTDSKPSLGYILSVNDLPTSHYHRGNNFTMLDLSYAHGWNGHGILTIDQAKLGLMNMVDEAFQTETGASNGHPPVVFQTETGASNGHPPVVLVDGDPLHEIVSSLTLTLTLIHVGDPLHEIENKVKELISNLLNVRLAMDMPKWEAPDILVIVEIFGSFLYPLVLSLQLPLYLYVSVMEKEERLTEMQLCILTLTLTLIGGKTHRDATMYGMPAMGHESIKYDLKHDILLRCGRFLLVRWLIRRDSFLAYP